MTRKHIILFCLILFGCNCSALAVLTVVNGPVSNVTRTAAQVHGSVTATNASNPTAILFYGTSDSTTNIASWGFSNNFGVAGISTNVFTNLTSLTPAQLYYYRWYATDGASNDWANASSNFTTLAGVPTSIPAVQYIFVMVDTNGTLIAPLQFFVTNNVQLVDGSTPWTSNYDANGFSLTNLIDHLGNRYDLQDVRRHGLNIGDDVAGVGYLVNTSTNGGALTVYASNATENLEFNISLVDYHLATNILSVDVTSLAGSTNSPNLIHVYATTNGAGLPAGVDIFSSLTDPSTVENLEYVKIWKGLTWTNATTIGCVGYLDETVSLYEALRKAYDAFYELGPRYTSGFQMGADADNATISNGTFKVVYSSFSGTTVSVTNQGYYVLKNNGDYELLSDLSFGNEYSDGTAIGNGNRFNVVLGLVPCSASEGVRIVALVQKGAAGTYVSDGNAEQDSFNQTVFAPALGLHRATWLPIMRLIVRKSAGPNFDIRQFSDGRYFKDIRSQAAGGGAGSPIVAPDPPLSDVLAAGENGGNHSPSNIANVFLNPGGIVGVAGDVHITYDADNDLILFTTPGGVIQMDGSGRWLIGSGITAAGSLHIRHVSPIVRVEDSSANTYWQVQSVGDVVYINSYDVVDDEWQPYIVQAETYTINTGVAGVSNAFTINAGGQATFYTNFVVDVIFTNGSVWNGEVIASPYFDRTGDWIGTFDGQEGSYYRNAANHTNRFGAFASEWRDNTNITFRSPWSPILPYSITITNLEFIADAGGFGHIIKAYRTNALENYEIIYTGMVMTVGYTNDAALSLTVDPGYRVGTLITNMTTTNGWGGFDYTW